MLGDAINVLDISDNNPLKIAERLNDENSPYRKIDKDNERRTSDSHYDRESNKGRDWLDVPVYSDSQCTTFVYSLPINCPLENRNVWLRRSIAIYLRSV